ncbi:MAG: glycosyltransferase family 2 protein [Bacteroidota bacterium]
MHPKISIITPSYNQGQFIEQTICSVLDQNYPNLEYIIMDGGSKDNTVEIIKKYEKHITHWVSENDKGQSDAINKGFKIASGDVINWLNSDDYYEKGALHKVGEAFSDPTTNAYLGISRIFGNKGEFFSTGTDVYADNLEKTIGWARIDQPETFFRKSCFDKIGYLDQQFHFIMDKELWIRYLLQYGFNGLKKTNDLLAHFRVHDDSKTNNFHEKFNKETLSLYHSIAKLNGSKFNTIAADLWPNEELTLEFKEHFIGDKTRIDKAINYSLFYLFLEGYAMNKYSDAKRIAALIDEKLLTNAEASHFRNIKLRIHLLPVFLKKVINKIR